MARAHWARVASEIRQELGVSWDEARAVYRELSRTTRADAGHRPGLVDVQRYADTVNESAEMVDKYGTKVLDTGEIGFGERLHANGVDESMFTSEIQTFADLDVPAYALESMARMMGGAQRDIEKRGSVSPARKLRIQEWMDEWDIPSWEYFHMLRELY